MEVRKIQRQQPLGSQRIGSVPCARTGSRMRTWYEAASRTPSYGTQHERLEVCDGLCVWQLLRRVLLEHDHKADDAKAQVGRATEDTYPNP